MNIMLGAFGAGILILALGACGSNVETDGEPDDGGSGGVGGSSSDGAGGAGEGGVAEIGGNHAGGSGDGGASDGGRGEGGMAEGGNAEGGASSVTCAAMAEIVLSNPTFVEAGGDSVWSASELAALRVTMTNESAEDNFFYPGIAVTADREGFVSNGNSLFGIFGSDSMDLDFSVQAPDSVEPGTIVTLTIQATTLNEKCPGLDTVELELTLD